MVGRNEVAEGVWVGHRGAGHHLEELELEFGMQRNHTAREKGNG